MSAIFISHSTKDHADTETMASWLKQQGHTSYFIDYDEKSGISAGTDWEQVLYQRLRQCQAIIALVTPDWLESKWCFAEMIQAREKGKPIFPVMAKPCQLPDLLTDAQKIDLVADPEGGYRRLALGLKEHGLDPTDVFDWDFMRPPYPGFPAFEKVDAAVFFGRSAEILSARETFEGLRRHSRDVPRLVLVLGSSGSGKSSLVRAGLIPRLKKDEKNWLPLQPFRPQDERSPLDALAFAIADTYKDLRLPCDSDLLRSRLRSAAESTPVDSGELLRIARELTSAADRREATVLVTVDQAEELLNSGSPGTGKTFLQFLGASLSADDQHLMAVATLRSDSLGGFQNQVASLESAYRVGLELRPLTVEPIPIERYAALIEGPARVAGLELEDSLVLKLLQDAGQPDSLPLLAFTLRRLYDLYFEGPQANRHTKLTLREYEELGGLAWAVQNAAEQIFKERPRTSEEINAFREAFIPGLIRYNEDGSYSRRRAFRDELPPGASGLLAGFIDARILVARADKDGHATVEIAHEALLRTWPILITWLGEDRDKLRQYNTIVRAAKEWDEGGRKSDLLVHRDGRLKDATKLISEQRFAFLPGSVEHTYLDACVTDQQAREAAAREERERRLRDAQRLAQEEAKRAQTESERAQEAEKFAREQAETAIVLKRRAWWLGLVALVALMAGIVAAWQWQRTERERTVAEARSQANNALRQFDSGRHIEGLLSAREAGQKLWKVARNRSFADYPTVTPLLALQTILDNICEQNRLEYWRQPNQALAQGNPGASDKECSLFLAGKQIALRDLPPQQLQQIMGHDSRILAWGCSPDGNYLVTTGVDGTVRLRNLLVDRPGRLIGLQGGATELAFDETGKRVTTKDVWGTIVQWDLSGRNRSRHEIALGDHDSALISVTFDSKGSRIATGGTSGVVSLWSANGSKIGKAIATGQGRIIGIKFDRSDSRIISVGENGTIKTWDLDGHLIDEANCQGTVIATAFNPDGGLVGTVEAGGGATIFSRVQHSHVRIGQSHQGWIFGATFNPKRDLVATAGADDTVRFWTLSGKETEKAVRAYHDQVMDVSFSPDGTLFATAGRNGTAKLWTLSGNKVAEFVGHRGAVLAVEFSPNGSLIATEGKDGTVRLWLPSGEQLAQLIGYYGAMATEALGGDFGTPRICFSPDSKTIAIVENGGMVHLWRIQQLDALLTAANEWLQPYLSIHE